MRLDRILVAIDFGDASLAALGWTARHLSTARATWSGGRGRKPQWVTQALKEGRDLEEFAVKNGR